MITSSLSPTSVTSVVRSSRPHGESRLLTRVHSWVSPKSTVLRDLDQTGAGRLLVGRPARRPRGCRAGCRPSARCRAPWRPSCRSAAGRSGSPGSAGTGSRGRGSGAPTASGRKKSLGGRIAPNRTRTTRIAPTRRTAHRPPGPPASRAQNDHEANGMRPRLRAGRRFRFGGSRHPRSGVRLDELDAIARRHHGVVTREMAGLNSQAWRRAIRGGTLVQLHPGVARLVGTADTVEQRVTAATFAVGSGTLASHRSAAFLWGAPRPDNDPVDLIVLDRSGAGAAAKGSASTDRPISLTSRPAAAIQHPLHEHPAHPVRSRRSRPRRRRGGGRARARRRGW